MQNPEGRVVLAGGRSASGILHAALAEALRMCGEDAAAYALPSDADVFRRSYADVLPRFEAARVSGSKRLEIARSAVDVLRRSIAWQPMDAEIPLGEALAVQVAAPELKVQVGRSTTTWQPQMNWRGRTVDATGLSSLGEELASQQIITRKAAEALSWVQEHLVTGGRISLAGRRIAMLGAGAEMSPTRSWLAAGADVLWLDTVAPPTTLLEANDFAARMYWPERPVDLLTRPQEVLALLMAFSEPAPLDVGLYAYAPGQAREMRLTGVMNAIIEAMPRERIRSVTMLVSPTSPTVLTAEEHAAMETKRRTRPLWQSALIGTGLLSGQPGCVTRDGVAVSRSVVGIQGASYQAAQYIGKILTAECWAHAESGFRVSANAAAVTKTRSLEHPVFAAAFGGTDAFDVTTLEPEQSRFLNGLLALHDWHHPDPPVPGALRVHGGVHTLPCPLESALKIAAGIGFARSPRLLTGLFRR